MGHDGAAPLVRRPNGRRRSSWARVVDDAHRFTGRRGVLRPRQEQGGTALAARPQQLNARKERQARRGTVTRTPMPRRRRCRERLRCRPVTRHPTSRDRVVSGGESLDTLRVRLSALSRTDRIGSEVCLGTRPTPDRPRLTPRRPRARDSSTSSSDPTRGPTGRPGVVRLRGRVFGVTAAATGAAQLLGILGSGYLADRTTVYVLLADAPCYLLAGLVILRARRHHDPTRTTGN